MDISSHLGIFGSFLSQNWLGTLLTIVGLGLTIFQFIRRQEPSPVYQHYGQALISSSGGLLPNEVSVQYDGIEVNQISITNIAFWNRGKEPIRAKDLLENHPLTFSFTDGKILKVDILKMTRDPIEPTAIINHFNPSELFLSFSFLDKNDGFLIRVLHTSQTTEPSFRGTIVGVPKGATDLGRPNFIPEVKNQRKTTFYDRTIRNIVEPSWINVIGSLILFSILMFFTIYYDEYINAEIQGATETASQLIRFAGAVCAIFYLAFAYISWLRVRRVCPDPISFDD